MGLRAAVMAAAILAACGSARAADGPAYHMPAYNMPAYHMYVPGRVVTPRVEPGAKTMLYFGGPVLAQSQVVSVIWSGAVAKTTIKQIGPFLKAIVNSTFVDQLAQYSTNLTGVNGHAGTDQTIVRGKYLGQVVIRPANRKKVLTDAEVQTELLAQIAAKKLPASNLNTLYMIYFPADITIVLDGSKSCAGFGAYHYAVSATVTPSNVFYGVMPDCSGGFGSYLTFASSHEFAEATTDAIPTPGSSPAYPQAWNSAEGYEIGDLCEGVAGTTLTTKKTTYTVTQVWDNSTNACGTGTFTSP
jgi:hypothetical protein